MRPDSAIPDAAMTTNKRAHAVQRLRFFDFPRVPNEIEAKGCSTRRTVFAVIEAVGVHLEPT
jgi:hypothetical protein